MPDVFFDTAPYCAYFGISFQRKAIFPGNDILQHLLHYNLHSVGRSGFGSPCPLLPPNAIKFCRKKTLAISL